LKRVLVWGGGGRNCKRPEGFKVRVHLSGHYLYGRTKALWNGRQEKRKRTASLQQSDLGEV